MPIFLVGRAAKQQERGDATARYAKKHLVEQQSLVLCREEGGWEVGVSEGGAERKKIIKFRTLKVMLRKKTQQW